VERGIIRGALLFLLSTSVRQLGGIGGIPGKPHREGVLKKKGRADTGGDFSRGGNQLSRVLAPPEKGKNPCKTPWWWQQEGFSFSLFSH